MIIFLLKVIAKIKLYFSSDRFRLKRFILKVKLYFLSYHFRLEKLVDYYNYFVVSVVSLVSALLSFLIEQKPVFVRWIKLVIK